MKHLLLLIVLCGCPRPIPPPPPPEPIDGAATCADACRRLVTMKCVEEPTPEGAMCVDVCENIMESEILRWDLDCRARAASCTEADECESQ